MLLEQCLLNDTNRYLADNVKGRDNVPRSPCFHIFYICNRYNLLSEAEDVIKMKCKQATPQLLCLYGMQPQMVKDSHCILPEDFNLF